MILVDADACPVKEEVYKVARRYGVAVRLVANAYMRVPREDLISLEVVSDAFDAADDRIVELVSSDSVVVTADILLADRCLKAGAETVLAPNGKPFTADMIGGAIATRAIMADLRGGGDQVGGPPPFTKQDRSRFLSALDTALVKLRQSK
ncbi:MAG: YaiI/YqxD family protein [Pseudomonadota bacterium]